MKNQANGSDIKNYLDIRNPEELSSSSPLISKTRLRAIDIDWRNVLGTLPTTADLAQKSTEFREYFEKSWGIVEMDKLNIETRKPWTEGDKINPTKYQNISENAYIKLKEKKIVACYYQPGTIKEMKIENGILMIHGTSKRAYLVTDENCNPIAEDQCPYNNSCTWGEYIKFWDSIDGLILVQVGAVKENELPQSTFIGSISGQIKADWVLLKSKKDWCDILDKSIDSWSTASKSDITLWQKNLEAPRRLFEENQTNKRIISEGISGLQKKAADMGLFLAIADEEKTLPNGQKITLKPGNIYRLVRRIFSWTVTETRERWVWDGDLGKILGRKRRELYTVNITKKEDGTDYEEIKDEPKPWIDYVQKLRFGSPQKDVHLAIKKDNKYINEDGVDILSILNKCDNDENTRLKTVIGIPSYAEGARGTPVLVGYVFFSNPLPAVKSSRLPSFFLRETLGFTIAWQGPQLGELVGTINLAPGEERAVNISTGSNKSASQATSNNYKVDASVSYNQEFSSELEKELRKESQQQGALSMSGSGSFGMDGFGFSAENSASYNATLLEVSRDFSKATSKAAKTITKNKTEEYSFSTTSSESWSFSNTTTTKVTNVNQELTANFTFFSINNIYKSAILLENLELNVVLGKEMMQGSGIFPTMKFRVSRIDDLLRNISKENIPLNLTDEQVEKLKNEVASKFIKTITEEYGKTTIEGGGEAKTDKSANAFQISLPKKLLNASNKLEIKDAADAQSILDSINSQIWQAYPWIIPSTVRDITLPTNSLYMDSVLGTNSALDDYARGMRDLEQEKIRSAIYLDNIKAANYRQLANRGGIESMQLNGNQISVNLVQPLTAGSWIVFIRKTPKYCFEVSATSPTKQILFSVTTSPGTLSDLQKTLRIVSTETGDTIVHNGYSD